MRRLKSSVIVAYFTDTGYHSSVTHLGASTGVYLWLALLQSSKYFRNYIHIHNVQINHTSLSRSGNNVSHFGPQSCLPRRINLSFSMSLYPMSLHLEWQSNHYGSGVAALAWTLLWCIAHTDTAPSADDSANVHHAKNPHMEYSCHDAE